MAARMRTLPSGPSRTIRYPIGAKSSQQELTLSAAAEIERFAKDTLRNGALRAEVKALGADQDAIVRLAIAKGYQFTMSDVSELGTSGELTDEQLSAVAGGIILLYSDGETTLSGGTRGTVYTSGTKTFIWL